MTVWSFLLRLSVVVMLSPVFVSSGQAADMAELLKGLGAKSRSHIRQAIGELGRLNDPAALPALEALGERRLRVDEAGNVYISQEDGQDDGLRAALSGEPVGLDPARLRTPRINNAIRRALRPVIAQLRLGSPQAEVRLAAAEELARRPQAEMVGPLQAALEREQAPDVRTALAVALAQLQLQSAGPGRASGRDWDDWRVRESGAQTPARSPAGDRPGRRVCRARRGRAPGRANGPDQF